MAKKLEAPELTAEKFLHHEADAITGLIVRERQNGKESAAQHFWLIAMFLWFASLLWWVLKWLVLPVLAIYLVLVAALATLAL